MSFFRKRSKNPKSFLIINTFGIGDVLFSTPLLRNLAEQFPEADFYYLANRKTADILSQHPLIKKVFVYERNDFVAEEKKSWLAALKKYHEFISEIRKKKIDVSIDLSLNTPFGFFALLAGIKNRYGLDYKKRGIFLTRKLPLAGFLDKHVVEYYLDVSRLMGFSPRPCAMEVYADRQSRDWAVDFLKNHSISEDELILGIAPCGGDAFGKDAYIKRWPAENFTKLIGKLIGDLKARIFIFAGPKEKADVDRIISGFGENSGIYEFSETSLLQTVALLEKCSLFIGNDTGPARFADALGKKVVALFGPVDEKVYGPYPNQPGRSVVLKNELPCWPCYSKFKLSPCHYNVACLSGITVERVFNAAQELLKRT